MSHSSENILRNEILRLDNLENFKIGFDKLFKGNWSLIDFYKNTAFDALLTGENWNYSKRKSYKEGQITIGFIWLNENHSWLLFHIGRIIKDLFKFDVGLVFKK